MELLGATDGDLTDRARGGDRDAFGELVRRHQTMAFRVAYHVLGDAGEAEDAVQEGFVKAYLALGRFRDGAAFRPWVLTIVGNEARNRRRSAGRRTRLAMRVWDPHEQLELRVEDAALAGPEVARVLAVVAQLPEPQRAVVVCRHVIGLSEKETAAALDVAIGTVKSRNSRGLDQIRRIMGAAANE